jgi:hypothetical protein
MLSKMKHGTPLGSRVAEVHNGSSIFTGDAGQGESNIRRWIIENDWLEAIIALPLNMFYNTGIATYVWVLTNRKPAHREGHVQLIDATAWSRPLRKNLGKKNCELSPEDIKRITDTFLAFEETEQSKIFPNAAFGYRKVTVERPLRLRGVDPERPHTPKEIKAMKAEGRLDEDAPPVIRKIHKSGVEPDPMRGRFAATINGKPAVVEYEPDGDLRDSEQVPLLEEGGVDAFMEREVLPHVPDAWYDPSSERIGYEISFTRHFLQATTVALARRDSCRHRGAGARGRRPARPSAGGGREAARGGAMTLRLAPYPASSPAKLHWLSALPPDWDVRRAKTLFTCVDVRSTGGEEELLTVSSSEGVVPRSTKNVAMFMAETYVGHGVPERDQELRQAERARRARPGAAEGAAEPARGSHRAVQGVQREPLIQEVAGGYDVCRDVPASRTSRLALSPHSVDSRRQRCTGPLRIGLAGQRTRRLSHTEFRRRSTTGT